MQTESMSSSGGIGLVLTSETVDPDPKDPAMKESIRLNHAHRSHPLDAKETVTPAFPTSSRGLSLLDQPT